MHSLKKTIHHHLHQDGHVLRFIYTLILVNVVVLIVSSHPFVRDQWGGFFYWFEFFSVMVFSAEYLLRIWTADLLERYEGPAWKKALALYGFLYGVDRPISNTSVLSASGYGAGSARIANSPLIPVVTNL
jgi:voltage-gated potassium channel